MKSTVVSAKYHAGKEDEKAGSVTIQTPENIEEAVQAFGGDAVLTNALSNWMVTLQSNLRSGLGKGENNEALQARLGAAKMGVAASKASIDPMAAFLAQYQSASPEERKAMKKKLLAEATAVDGK